jgi:sulfur relay protein TusB/DsrH
MVSLRLHLLMNPAALDDLAGQLHVLDQLVLLDRGTELLMQPDAIKQLLNEADEVYCSRPDREARGLPLPPGVTEIDDMVLVALVEARCQVLSWT